MSDLRVAIRTAMVLAVTTSLAGSPFAAATVLYRPTRRPITLPAVTMYDTGTKIDNSVPLYERSFHLDVWGQDIDEVEEIAHLINAVLDHRPLALPGDEGNVAFLMLQSDQDQPQDDADLVRKMLTYVMRVYEYNGPQPV